MEAQFETIGRATGGHPYQSPGVSNTPVDRLPPPLAKAGIDKNLANAARADAALGAKAHGIS
jgi:hypothetical protein